MPVYEYTTKSGEKRYTVRYRKPDHSLARKSGFARKTDAKKFLHQVESEKLYGTYVDPRKGKVTVAELGEPWLAAKKGAIKASAYRPLEIDWRLRVKPRWGGTPVATITRSDVQAWLTEIGATRSGTVVRRCRGILSGILGVAVANRRMVKNVASDRGYEEKLQLVPKGQKERRYLTHAQVALLASKARAGWRRVLVYTLAYTGLRWGEAAALRLRDVDYKKRHLRISKNSVQLGGAGTDETTTKSGKTRVVPFPKKLTQLLKALTAGRRPDDRVFGDDPEKPIRQPYPRDGWFALAVKKSHDDDEAFPLGLTPHDLRHTAASLMISSGANVLVVQRCLGHESAQMTLDTYADLFTDDLDAVADALDGRLIV